jgi:hypothetical protein
MRPRQAGSWCFSLGRGDLDHPHLGTGKVPGGDFSSFHPVAVYWRRTTKSRRPPVSFESGGGKDLLHHCWHGSHPCSFAHSHTIFIFAPNSEQKELRRLGHVGELRVVATELEPAAPPKISPPPQR